MQITETVAGHGVGLPISRLRSHPEHSPEVVLGQIESSCFLKDIPSALQYGESIFAGLGAEMTRGFQGEVVEFDGLITRIRGPGSIARCPTVVESMLPELPLAGMISQCLDLIGALRR